jgi:hypothetical protein
MHRAFIGRQHTRDFFILLHKTHLAIARRNDLEIHSVVAPSVLQSEIDGLSCAKTTRPRSAMPTGASMMRFRKAAGTSLPIFKEG